jgi:hypothetical protein
MGNMAGTYRFLLQKRYTIFMKGGGRVWNTKDKFTP